MTQSSDVLISAEEVTKQFRLPQSLARRLLGQPPQAVHALNGVSFTLHRGETLGIVGESGCGKSTLARCLVRLYDCDDGKVRFEGEDIAHLAGPERRAFNRRVQMIFQDPYSSLNPRMTVRQVLAEALSVHRMRPKAEIPARIAELLELVRLPADAADRYPHEFSGGQRQRIGIARALAVNPKFIVADEPVSALDVSIQAQIINLLQDLRREMGLSILFIGHDLSVIEFLCDRVIVLYLGHVMETARASDLYLHPRHPYTRALLDAAPVPDPTLRRDRVMLKGDIPSPVNPPSGCVFRTRCPFAIDRCAEAIPPLEVVGLDHAVACIRKDELQLSE
jgi:oligopeptide/dipeptide ABC transporter ATP-binding protein